MLSIAAFMLSSCFNQDPVVDNQEAEDELNQMQVIEKYNQVFVRAFGVVAPYQNWGFDNTYTSSSETDTDGYKFFARIFGEDLNEENLFDFDFNDVVFDVLIDDNNNAKIRLLAVGCTQEIIVDGHEVHKEFGTSTTTMVNIGAGGMSCAPVEFEIKGKIQNLSDVKAIKVMVNKGNEIGYIELLANLGIPAAKIAAQEQIEWPEEHMVIAEKYPNFIDWISGSKPIWW